MNNSQSIINFNNQSSERNASMEIKGEVNRITDGIRNEIKDGMLEAGRMGVPWEVAFKGVRKFVLENHGISEPLSQSEEGKIGGTLNRWVKTEFDKLLSQFYVRVSYKGEKICSKCKDPKPLSEFSSHSDSPDGLQYWCKECYSKYNRNKKTAEADIPEPLFKNVFDESDTYTFTVSTNNVQVVYENDQLFYSRIDDSAITDTDLDDVLRLRKRANEKIANLSRSN